MAKKCQPYHSMQSDVYHIYSDCSVGNNIPLGKKKQGSEGRKLCAVCRKIQAGKRKR
jgi:hypothetical protein